MSEPENTASGLRQRAVDKAQDPDTDTDIDTDKHGVPPGRSAHYFPQVDREQVD